MTEEGKRIIKLFCPSLSKVAQLVAWDDQRLDLGSIARTLGLDPVTIRFNGHFISRGVDLIASSVTWKSLLSFFSARGLSTGITDSEPLVVDGKLCKVGTKRAHDPSSIDSQWGNRKPPPEDSNLLKKTKFRDFGFDDEENKITKNVNVSLKRKKCLDAVSPLKKIQIDKTDLEV